MICLAPVDQTRLEQTPLYPDRWPFALEHLPPQAHLVGGIVRDALLNRQADYLDLDFVVPHSSIETARAIAHHYNAGFVVLDPDRQIARIVFDNATVDFALQEGQSIDQDLRRRDFTINAIAFDPHNRALVDPLGGYIDLQRKCLRMVSAENLADDPLRLLRAYRQASQLGFYLDERTEAVIYSLADQLSSVAAERVRSELDTLLAHPTGTRWLHRAQAAGLLQHWLPDANADRLDRVANAHNRLLQQWPSLSSKLAASLQEQGALRGLTRNSLSLARLVLLLSADPSQAAQTLDRLKCSRAEIRAAETIRRRQPQLQSPLAIRDQYDLFQDLGPLVPTLILVTIVDRLTDRFIDSTPDPSTTPDSRIDQSLSQDLAQGAPWVTILDRSLNPIDPVAHPRPLLTGRDLMTALDLNPSPKIGRLLKELQIAQAEGQIKSRAEAIDLARQLAS